MRRRIKYILLFFVIFTQFSCEDYMELYPPDGLIREEFWKNRGDVEAVLMSAYQKFAKMDDLLFVLGEVRADMVVGDVNQDQDERFIAESNIYPDNPLCNWVAFYEIINNCNEVIKNAPLVQNIDNTFSGFERQGLVSEAYFLRSLAYFYLVRFYKEVPLILEPTESDSKIPYFTQSSEETILNQIVTDLENNRAYGPNGQFVSVEENKGRASRLAFDALLADIALWRFDYEAVVRYVERMEEMLVLLPDSRWFELFYPGNSLEGIFEFQFDNALSQVNGTYALTNQNNEQYKSSPKANSLLALDAETNPELIRGETASIKRTGESDFIIWKYVGQAGDGLSARSGAVQNSCNWIVYRSADVLLMKAEALSQLGRYEEAREIINGIRDRAGVPPVKISNSPVAFEDAILAERAIELSFEGKRWFDLLRMGRRDDFARKSKLIEIMVSNVPSAQKRILAVKLTDPAGWYLPVYAPELDRNKLLNQNPYYDSK